MKRHDVEETQKRSTALLPPGMRGYLYVRLHNRSGYRWACEEFEVLMSLDDCQPGKDKEQKVKFAQLEDSSWVQCDLMT